MISARPTTRERYPITQSPFYRLRSPHKLAELLGVSLPELLALSELGKVGYSFFKKQVKGKLRDIEHPKLPLRRIQRELTNLLQRIRPPAYLHSAYRGFSYVTNAAEHGFAEPSAKIDIRTFFVSARSERVSRAFREQFLCDPHVAAIIGRLTTVLGHIPTGGNSSTMISFWAYKPMFDEIDALASANGLKMTCCVDDMTFTGPRATEGFVNSVRAIIARYGLRGHKRHVLSARTPKVITGVAVTSGGLRLPNKRRLLLHEAFVAVEAEKNPTERVIKARRLLGRAVEAFQVEPRFRGHVASARRILNQAISDEFSHAIATWLRYQRARSVFPPTCGVTQ